MRKWRPEQLMSGAQATQAGGSEPGLSKLRPSGPAVASASAGRCGTSPICPFSALLHNGDNSCVSTLSPYKTASSRAELLKLESDSLEGFVKMELLIQ